MNVLPGIAAGTPGINGPGISGTNSGASIHPIPKLTDGAIAYRQRKQAMWEDLARKADRIFTRTNPAYQSPL